MFARLEDIDCKVDYFGGKAMNLAKLVQHEVRVPNGFAMSFAAFEKYLSYNQIEHRKEVVLSQSVQIQLKLQSGTFPKEVKDEWEQYFTQLKEMTKAKEYVVRSSCSCEDSGKTSMAGIFETFANLHSFEELEKAAKACYASMYSDKAIAWMLKNHINIESARMGLVIQEFIPGHPSGVMFTVDTVTMKDDVICINTVDDVCSNFVDGSNASRMYQVDKVTGNRIEDDSINKIQVASSQMQNDFLEQDLIFKLYETAKKVEDIFHCYQDIEWTTANKQIVVLQARPVTTFYKQQPFEIQWKDEKESQNTWFRLCEQPCPPILKKVYETEAANIAKGAFDAALRMELYGDLTEQNGYYYGGSKELNEEALQRNAKRYEGFIEVNSLLEKEVFIDVVLPELESDVDHMMKLYQEPVDAIQCLSLLDASVSYIEKCARLHDLASKSADMIIYAFTDYCISKCKTITSNDIFDLLYSESLMSKERKALLSIVNEIKSDKQLSTMFSECLFDELLYARLQVLPHAKQLLDDLDEYCKTYGISGNVFDVALPEICYENPVVCLRKVRSILNVNDIQQVEQSVITTRQNKIENQFVHNLHSDEEKQEFNRRLKLARKAFLAKDNHHVSMDSMPRGLFRLAISRCAKILVSQGVLQSKEDIIYLTVDEVRDLLHIQNQNMSNLMNERKAMYEKQIHMVPPEIIGNLEINFDYPQGSQKQYQSEMNGVSGLKKKVTGTAYFSVPNCAKEDMILVLPNGHSDIMDILEHVKGIIFEGGSPYDHLGIIAREWNIPTLYYVSDVFHNVKPGDRLELDGIDGKVRILV